MARTDKGRPDGSIMPREPPPVKGAVLKIHIRIHKPGAIHHGGRKLPLDDVVWNTVVERHGEALLFLDDDSWYDELVTGQYVANRMRAASAAERRRVSGHQAYPPERQRQIVSELLTLERGTDPPTREEFAQRYGITDRTLRNYLRRWLPDLA